MQNTILEYLDPFSFYVQMKIYLIPYFWIRNLYSHVCINVGNIYQNGLNNRLNSQVFWLHNLFLATSFMEFTLI